MIEPIALLILGVIGVYWGICHLILIRTNVVLYAIVFFCGWSMVAWGTFLGLGVLFAR